MIGDKTGIFAKNGIEILEGDTIGSSRQDETAKIIRKGHRWGLDDPELDKRFSPELCKKYAIVLKRDGSLNEVSISRNWDEYYLV